jgi:dTDP-glucose 4,6-dehydratase
MKVVYVTGCLGFIGSYVTRLCLQKGWYVKGVDKITYAANKDLLNEFDKYSNFSFVNCDINDLKFLYDCDYFINTAAETHVGNSIVDSTDSIFDLTKSVDSTDFVKSNIDGVHNILNLFRNYRQENNHKPVFLHFSTDEVYGDIDEGEHVETDLLKPSNPYSATKAAADMLISAWARTYNINYVIVRPTNNYGIGQYVEKLIPKSVKFLSLGRKIPLHNNGSPVRNWLHAEDTANGVIKIIESDVRNEVFNICGGYEQTNYQTVEKIIKSFYAKNGIQIFRQDEITKNFDFTYSRAGQDVRYALNDNKLRSLGWNPKHDFDKDISDIVGYYKNVFIW